MAMFFMEPPNPPHSVSLEMGEYNHGVIVNYMPTHSHFLKTQPSTYGEAHIPFLVHDVNGTKCPTIDLERFTM